MASMLLDPDGCRRILNESFPELDARSVRYFDRGWDYELWEVNGDLLFRFPKRPECAGPLRVEARLLTALTGHLSLPIPQPEYVSDGCDAFPQPFFGYRKLPGMPLEQDALSDAAQQAIARQLGRFLNELHSFSTVRAAELGVPSFSPDGWREDYRTLKAKCDRDVAPLLSRDERRSVEEFWRSYLDNERNFQFEPVLLHGDLSPEHILVDLERTAITGVIDFGDAVVGDPAGDFGGFTAAFRHSVLETYRLPVDETLLTRAIFYPKLSPFHKVLYGLKIEDRTHVEAGLSGIRECIITAE